MAGASKDPPGARRGPRQPWDGVLAGHERRGQMMVPPLMQHGPPTARSWFPEMLPDFLWLAAMLGRRSDWQAAYPALDVIDRFVPSGGRFADGRLTTFALVPPEARADARAALQREVPHALPDALGQVLVLYPSCPARWLYDDWLERHRSDRTHAVTYLRSFIMEHADKAGVRETRLRMAAFSRRVTHGQMSHSGAGVFELFPLYPGGLSTPQQRQVESTLRAMWGSLWGIEVDRDPSVLDWSRDFWIRNRELVPCLTTAPDEADLINPNEEDGPLDPEPLMQLSEMRALLDALRAQGDRLRESQQATLTKPAADEGRAVLLGLASRLFRLLHDFLERPSAWTAATAPLHLRALLDTRILSAWLMKRDNPATYAAYREHGLGRLKLLRDHVAADFGENPPEERQAFLEYLNRRVNLEIDELWQPVNLGNIERMSVREMANEAGLERDYKLAYAPYSSASHGEWPVVREQDTLICEEPLHAGHRLGAFAVSPREVSANFPMTAYDYASTGIDEVFRHLGTEPPSWVAVEAALRTALYVKDDEADDGQSSEPNA